jgi:chromosome segregation ATPase
VVVKAPRGDELVQRWSDVGQLLGNRFASIDGQLVELRSDVAELKTDMAELKTDMVEVKADMVEVKADVAELKTDVAQLNTDMTALKGQVGRLEESTRLGFQRMDANFEQLRHLIARDERRNPPPGPGKAPRPRKQ